MLSRTVIITAVPVTGRVAVRRREPARAAREGEARRVPPSVIRAARLLRAAPRLH